MNLKYYTIEVTEQQAEHLKVVLAYYNQARADDDGDLFDFLNFQEKAELQSLLRDIAQEVHE